MCSNIKSRVCYDGVADAQCVLLHFVSFVFTLASGYVFSQISVGMIYGNAIYKFRWNFWHGEPLTNW